MAVKKTPVDALTAKVLVLLPEIMASTPKGITVRDKVRLAFETAAEMESIERDLKTAWSNDDSTEWAVKFWEKYEAIR